MGELALIILTMELALSILIMGLIMELALIILTMELALIIRTMGLIMELVLTILTMELALIILTMHKILASLLLVNPPGQSCKIKLCLSFLGTVPSPAFL